MLFLHLDGKSPQNYQSYKRGSKLLCVRNDLSIFLSSKKLIMTNLRVSALAVPLISSTRENMYSDRCEALAPGILESRYLFHI